MPPTATKPDLKGKLEQVNEQIAAKRQVAQEKWQEFESAREQFAAAGEDQNNTDSDLFKASEEAHREYATAASEVADLEHVRDGVFGMLGGSAPKGDPATQPGPVVTDETRTLGQRAVESEGYQELVDSGVLSSDRAHFNAKLGEIGLEQFAALLTGTSDTSGGAFVVNDPKAYVPQPRRRRSVLDLITTGSTGSDTVEYVRQTTFTNVAVEVAEATSTTTGTKPEATIAFEKVTAAVKNIAHWVPATRRSLADVAQLRTLVDSQLRYGLEYRLEGQVVSGAGTGEELTGILNTSNILTQAKSSDSVADAIHKAITQIRLGYIEPNGVALHPTDWQLLRLARDDGGATAGTGGYLYGPPAMAGAEQIWGLPVAVTPAVPDDTGIVGDFSSAVLWLREGVQVLASDSHDDFFVKNLVAILAEMRAAFGVLLPQSFCKVTSLD